MDPESLATSTTKAPRKVRFAPKAPPKREQNPVLPKVEKVENDINEAQAEQLLRKLNETSLKGKPKVERKPGTAQVAFGYAGSSASLKSYGVPKIFNIGTSSDVGGPEHGVEKEYKEPWDYYSYYPVTLPMRRPYSGNPELLDKEEFEEDPVNSAHDEHATNTAAELGLMGENMEDNIIFFQLPKTMPMVEQSTNEEIHEPDNNTKPVKCGGRTLQKPKPDNLESLPAGYMGKILVYKSGAVKLKLGDMLYDVSAGLNCVFSQDVFAINTEERNCCNMGELNKRGVISPDVDCILDIISDLYEKVENDINEAQAEQLLRKLNETSLKGKPKIERKPGTAQVAFGYAGSSASLKSYGVPKIFNIGTSLDVGGPEHGVEKEYKEPWDYYSYYPVILPMRRPYSGNPELLDKEEFEEDLGENMEDNIIFFQLPKTMPMVEQSTNEEIHEPDNNTKPIKCGGRTLQKPKPDNLESHLAGYMGKMLVHRSGAVKLKLGDMLYDVSASLNCVFSQDVFAINTEERNCCNMGELNKRAVITPDIDCILDTISDL